MPEMTSHTTGGATRFSEEQRFTQTWVWFMVLLAAAGAWVNFTYQIGIADQTTVGSGDRTASWVLLVTIGILMPWLFRALRLQTDLVGDRLEIRYRPLCSRTIPLAEIARCYARTYRPIMEYGGWGVRWGGRGSMAYNVSGNHGVQLELKNGKRVLVGSLRAEALARAICDAAGLALAETKEKSRS